jgi:hypothetical protein
VVTGAARAEQDVHVTGMQQVEYPVGEDDPTTLRLAPAAGALPVAEPLGGIDDGVVAQKMPSACGFRYTSRTVRGSSMCS